MKTNFKFSDEDKQQVFEIALALMDDIGYEKLTIRRVCNEANISIGKFYRLFKSKEDLLSFFYADAAMAYKHNCEMTLAGKDIESQVIDFYYWYTGYAASYGIEFISNFFSSSNPVMNTHIYNNEIINITDNLLVQAISKGYSVPEGRTVREISCDLCVVVKGIIFDWCTRHGEFNLAEATRELLTRCANGILYH